MSMHGAGSAAAWRHLRSDRSVVNNRIDRRTVGRVLRFAGPHKALIAVFLVITVVDAAMVVVTPLLVQRIVDDGILAGDRALVAWLALAMAGVALFSALLSVFSGWLSSRIGEGLIFDLRTRVFGHVQRQSLAFFTRTQTGALVSRLNNDVIGAQRAVTTTLGSVLSNVIVLTTTLAAMLLLEWRLTLLALVLLPVFIIPAQRVGRRMQALTREG